MTSLNKYKKFDGIGKNLYFCSMKRMRVFLWLLISCISLPLMAQETVYQDSLQTLEPALEEFSDPNPVPVALPWRGNVGLSSWDLHQGLNGQISAGVNVGFGKHNPWKGASFFTSLAGLYVLPVSKNGRWTGAVGGYFSNFRMFGQQVNTVGVIGLADYQINDRMSVTGFLMHDFGVLGGQKGMFMPMLGLNNPSTTLGGEFNMRLGEKACMSIGVSVTNQQYNYLPNQFLPPPSVSPHTHMVRD